MRSTSLLTLALSIGALIAPAPSGAKVVRIEIDSREDVLAGRAFGPAGPYEKIAGRIYFTFDPTNPFNARIVDLDNAPRNADGLVEAWANFMVLRPKNPVSGGGVALLEVSNRGGKASLSYFNSAARSSDPETAEEFGDGLLMRLGLTVIWVGWQWDVPQQEGRLRLHVPAATEDGEPIEGLVRSDWTVDSTVHTLEVAHRSHIAYPVADPASPRNVLTVRDGRESTRRIVPRTDWRFGREDAGSVVEDPTSIYMESGFLAGKIYELVYVARDPKVVGLGLAAIRDVISYAKYDASSPFLVQHGVAIGISQTGRFLRHFIYQGFNTDEAGRKAFDGLIAQTAGAGRGSFNHRFAQPSRDGHPYSAFFYPSDIFPFTSRTQTDALTGASDGLFAHAFNPDHLPKVFFTNSGYEYWGRAASLIHMTADGTSDVELYPNERIYHFASAQHFVGRFPPRDGDALAGTNAYRGNPVNFLFTMRALLTRMVEWVRDDTPPSPSSYPRIADGTLVPIEEVRFPKIPGLTLPSVAHVAYRADYGPRWIEGIIELQPPELGPAFPVLVPQVDLLGNELGGLSGVEVLAPLATYAPWNLRTGYPGGTTALTNFLGTLAPLPLTESQRNEDGDARPSIESLYSNRADYLAAVERAALRLVSEGTLLEEDVGRTVERAATLWDWVQASAQPGN